MNASEEKSVALFVVVVLYKIHPSASPALQSLLHALDKLSAKSSRVSVLLWDNTPEAQNPGTLDSHVRYHAATHNPGLATAYNRAIEMAAVEGFEWLLTLDQDSELPPDFLKKMVGLIRLHASDPEMAAVVPRVLDGSRTLSPYRLVAGGIPRWFTTVRNDPAPGPIYAMNSGAVLRLASLQEMGGYDLSFPLDLSDINLFHRMGRAGRRVVVADTLTIQHQLALLDKEGRMSTGRYRAGLLDECAFYDMHMNWLGRLERLLRLAGRTYRDRLPSMKPFRDVTVRELRRRLGTSRARRLQEWRAWVDAGRPS